MKLSTKSRYAVTAMLDIAVNDRQGPVTLAEISSDQGISLSYLEQLFARLRRHGLVEGVRGPGGGYRLGRPSDRITIADIIAAVDENVVMTRCEGKANCQGGDRCLTHELWDELSRQLYDFLDGLTLADVAGPPASREAARRREQRSPQQNPASLAFGPTANVA